MNLYAHTTPKSGETFSSLLEYKNIKIIRIVSSADVDTIAYRQDEDEWVVVIEGKATLLLDGEKRVLYRGDTLFIPAKTPHSILQTEEGTVWLAVHIY